MDLPSRDRVMALLEYDAETGAFMWKVTKSAMAPKGSAAGRVASNGYVGIGIDHRRIGAHRLAWLCMTGSWPDGDIDHINGDRADNRWSNLRCVSRSVNLQNRRHSHGKVGLLGAYHCGRKFMSRIRLFGKDIYLGVFDTAEAAHAAYLKAKRELHEGCTI